MRSETQDGGSPFDRGVGMDIERGGQAGGCAVMDHLEGSCWRRLGVVAQCDCLSDKGRIDLVEAAVQRDRVGLVDLACDLEQEQCIEIETRVGIADPFGIAGPAVEGCFTVEAAMRGEVILGLNPCAEVRVERFQVPDALLLERGQALVSTGSEQSLDLAFSSGMVGAGMDECDIKAAADDGQLP